jgi:quercetin dioxygenase-like cupin family protein
MASAPLLTPKERMIPVSSAGLVPGISGGVQIRTFVSSACGATSFSTYLAIFEPGARLALHQHPVSEALTVVEGEAVLQVEGRIYRMSLLDCAHVPAGEPHAVSNDSPDCELIIHTAFASAQPTRELVDQQFRIDDRRFGDPTASDPENIIRFAKSPIYELAPEAFFTDLFARRFGAVGICGGYGRFQPGASLPCHIHEFDESITIIQGSAKCMVQGRQYELSGCATAHVPEGLPHRFLNQSNQEMAMIWVYAGGEPDRQIVENGYCSGTLSWPGAKVVADIQGSEKEDRRQ